MSLKIGGSSSNSSSNSTSNTSSSNNFNATTTPIVPEWAASLTQGIAGRVGELGRADPQSFVAPANGLQSQAGATAGGLSGSPWNFDAALGETRYVLNADAARTGAVQAAPYLQRYTDPYLRDVVGATDADLTAHEGQVRAQQALDLAGSGAFSGSGAALTQSLTEGELARARAATLSGLRSQGFSQGLGAAQQDAQRAQGAKDLNAQLYGQQMDRALLASRQLGDLSTSYESNQRANIAAQLQAGEALRGVAQQQAQAPLNASQQVVAMLSGLPLQLFTGQQQQGSSTGMSTTRGSQTSRSSGVEGSASADFSKVLGLT